jgi:glutathione-specific gamma-glutamylcyclotransferase
LQNRGEAGINVPRWPNAKTADGPVRALGFMVKRASPHYADKLAPEAAADIVSVAAAGHWGPAPTLSRKLSLV